MSAAKYVVPLCAAVQPMIAEAQQQGVAIRSLPRDLKLSLNIEGDAWTLILGREGEAPSEREVQLVMNAFDVPRAAVTVRFVQWRGEVVQITWTQLSEREVGS